MAPRRASAASHQRTYRRRVHRLAPMSSRLDAPLCGGLRRRRASGRCRAPGTECAPGLQPQALRGRRLPAAIRSTATPTHPVGRRRDPAHPGPTAGTRVFQLLASVRGLSVRSISASTGSNKFSPARWRIGRDGVMGGEPGARCQALESVAVEDVLERACGDQQPRVRAGVGGAMAQHRHQASGTWPDPPAMSSSGPGSRGRQVKYPPIGPRSSSSSPTPSSPVK